MKMRPAGKRWRSCAATENSLLDEIRQFLVFGNFFCLREALGSINRELSHKVLPETLAKAVNILEIPQLKALPNLLQLCLQTLVLN